MVRHSVKHGIPFTYIIRANDMIDEDNNYNDYQIRLKAPVNVGTQKFLMSCQGVYSCSTTGTTTAPSYQTHEFRIDIPSISHDTTNESSSNTVGFAVFDTSQKTYVSHLPFQKVIFFSGDSIYRVKVYADGVTLATVADVPAHIISLLLTPIYDD